MQRNVVRRRKFDVIIMADWFPFNISKFCGDLDFPSRNLNEKNIFPRELVCSQPKMC